MSGNRKAATAEILTWVNKLDPSGDNGKLLTAMFVKMTDADFEAYITAIEKGEDFVSLVYTNLSKSAINTDNNLVVAKQMGHDFFQRLRLTDEVTGLTYLTPQKFLTGHAPTRRQIQTLENKISIPEDNKHVDDMTDQPTGPSKGSSLSQPEILALYAQGDVRGIEEMIKYRGGDLKAMVHMDRQIIETGGASMDRLAQADTVVKSTQTLSSLLKGMHIDNNFTGT